MYPSGTTEPKCKTCPGVVKDPCVCATQDKKVFTPAPPSSQSWTPRPWPRSLGLLPALPDKPLTQAGE